MSALHSASSSPLTPSPVCTGLLCACPRRDQLPTPGRCPVAAAAHAPPHRQSPRHLPPTATAAPATAHPFSGPRQRAYITTAAVSPTSFGAFYSSFGSGSRPIAVPRGRACFIISAFNIPTPARTATVPLNRRTPATLFHAHRGCVIARFARAKPLLAPSFAGRARLHCWRPTSGHPSGAISRPGGAVGAPATSSRVTPVGSPDGGHRGCRRKR